MIWKPISHSRAAQFADFVTAFIVYIVSYYFAFLLFRLAPSVFPPKIEIGFPHIMMVLLLCYAHVLVFNANKAYNFQRFTSLLTEYSIVVKVVLTGFLLTIATLFLTGYNEIPRTIIISYFLISLILFLIEKSLLFYFASIIRKKGKNRKRVIIVGTGTRAVQFIKTVNMNFSWGLDIVGVLTGDSEYIGKDIEGIKVIDHYKNIKNVLKEVNPEELIITLSTKRFDQIRDVIESCEKAGINIRLNSDFFGQLTKNVQVDNVYGLNIISFYPVRYSEIELFFKRAVDFVLSLAAIILLSPVFFFIALLIYFQDGFPIFYKWKIVGFNRKPVISWKFRTMVKNADEIKKELMKQNEMSGPVFKLTNDPRILPIGHFLRKYSLDELPQLFSVLKGDLSLVGPRPPLQYEFNEFELWQRRKLSVKPGLTCLWQISGRSEIKSFDEWAKLDLEYIDNWSIWLDFKILFKTIPIVFSGRGAK